MDRSCFGTKRKLWAQFSTGCKVFWIFFKYCMEAMVNYCIFSPKKKSFLKKWFLNCFGIDLFIYAVMSIISDWEKCRKKQILYIVTDSDSKWKLRLWNTLKSISSNLGTPYNEVSGFLLELTLNRQWDWNPLLAASYVSPKSNTITKALSYLAGSALRIYIAVYTFLLVATSPVRQKINASQEYIRNEHHLIRTSNNNNWT